MTLEAIGPLPRCLSVELSTWIGAAGTARPTSAPILPAALGEDGPIAGATEEAWAALLVTLA